METDIILHQDGIKDGQILQNYGIMTEDTIVYLPITESAYQLNKRIANVPHTLNNHTLIFLFVIPTTLTEDSDQNYQYSLYLGDESLLFQGFTGGQMYIYGDFLHDVYTEINGIKTKIFSKFSKKNQLQINDPKKYDSGFNISNFIENIKTDIEYHQNINNIIKYQQFIDGDSSIPVSSSFNKIKIYGSGLNKKYSFFTINNVTSKTYIKNLSFQSSLQFDKNGYFNYSQYNSIYSTTIPTKDKLLLYYPFSQNLMPIITNEFLNYTINENAQKILDNLQTEYLSINSNLTKLQNCISGQISSYELSIYYNLQKDCKKIISGFQQNLLKKLWNQLQTLLINTQETKNFKPTTNIQFYLKDSTLNKQLILSKLTLFKYYINQILCQYQQNKNNNYTRIYLSDQEKKDNSTQLQDLCIFNDYIFKNYIFYRKDLIVDEKYAQLNNLSVDDVYNIFYKSIKEYTTNIQNSLINLQEISQELNLITTNEITNNQSSLYFKKSSDLNESEIANKGITFEKIDNKGNQYNKNIKTNTNNKTLKSLQLYQYSNDIKTDFSYIYLNSIYSKYIGKLLFGNNIFNTNIQKFPQYLKEYSKFYDEKSDTTLIVWTKFLNGTIYQPLISIYDVQPTSGIEKFKFQINTTSIISQNEKIQLIDNDVFDDQNTKELKDSWIMWSIKFDSTSRNIQKNLVKPYKDKIGIQVTAYRYGHDSNNKLIIKRYEKNKTKINAVTDKNEISEKGLELGLQTYLQDNYLKHPYNYIKPESYSKETEQQYNLYNSQFENIMVKIGYNQSSLKGYNQFNGNIRNLMIFKGHLTPLQEISLFDAGIKTSYDLPTVIQQNQLQQLIKGGKFYIGSIGIYDSTNINILNCNIKFNGKTYKIN